MTFARLRRLLMVLTLLVPLSVGGQAAEAQSLQDNIIAQLQAQGFVDFRISRTLLGRVQIVATGPDFRREIVFNPHTGEILRDYLSTTSGQTADPRLISPDRRRHEGRGPARDSTDDRDRDEDDDKEREDDDDDRDEDDSDDEDPDDD